MDIETRLTEIFISIFIIVIILVPIVAIGLLISNINKEKHIHELEMKINYLEFEKEYLDFIYEDNIRQQY